MRWCCCSFPAVHSMHKHASMYKESHVNVRQGHVVQPQLTLALSPILPCSLQATFRPGGMHHERC